MGDMKLNDNKVKINDDGVIEAPEIKINTGSLLFDNCTKGYTNSRNLEWLSNAEPNRHEAISSVYDETGSYPPVYPKKDSLRTLDGQLLDDAQTTSSSITIPVPEDSHWMELILKPRASGEATFSIKYTDANGCVLNTITTYTFQPAQIGNEVSVPLGNPISLIGGRSIFVTYKGVAVAGHNYVGHPVWGTQFVPFVKTNSHPYEDFDVLTEDVYDPTSKKADAFSMDNMAETATEKILTAIERSKLAGIEEGAEVNQPDISCKVTKLADQLIPELTVKLLSWNQTEYDTDDMHDDVTDNSQILINTAGKYSLLLQGSWGSNANGRRIFILVKNGSEIARLEYSPETSSNHTFSWVGELEEEDILTMYVWQNSNEANLEFLGGAGSYMEIHKIN